MHTPTENQVKFKSKCQIQKTVLKYRSQTQDIQATRWTKEFVSAYVLKIGEPKWEMETLTQTC